MPPGDQFFIYTKLVFLYFTAEEVEEEEMLRSELKKIEARKKEREKKTQDLQKLIAQADSSSKNLSGLDKKALKKKMIGANGSSLQSKSPIKEQVMNILNLKFLPKNKYAKMAQISPIE